MTDYYGTPESEIIDPLDASDNYIFALLKKLSMATVGAALIAFGTVATAQAATIVTGSITQPTPETTTVDYFNFSVNTAGTVTMDVLAQGIDFGNGISGLDSQLYLFTNNSSLDASDFIATNDDDLSLLGFSDGSVNSLDSYLSQFLDIGNYILAISEYNFSLDEAVAGIQTDPNFLGLNNGDYQITFTGDVTVGNPSTSVPEPTSTLGLLAFGTLGAGSMLKRKKAMVKA